MFDQMTIFEFLNKKKKNHNESTSTTNLPKSTKRHRTRKLPSQKTCTRLSLCLSSISSFFFVELELKTVRNTFQEMSFLLSVLAEDEDENASSSNATAPRTPTKAAAAPMSASAAAASPASTPSKARCGQFDRLCRVWDGGDSRRIVGSAICTVCAACVCAGPRATWRTHQRRSTSQPSRSRWSRQPPTTVPARSSLPTTRFWCAYAVFVVGLFTLSLSLPFSVFLSPRCGCSPFCFASTKSSLARSAGCGCGCLPPWSMLTQYLLHRFNRTLTHIRTHAYLHAARRIR